MKFKTTIKYHSSTYYSFATTTPFPPQSIENPTNTDIYIHWNAFAPKTWKIGTLHTLTKRAHIVCSNDNLLDKELQHLFRTFHEINGYPEPVINRVFTNVKRNHLTPPSTNDLSTTPVVTLEQDETTPPITHLLILPYKGKTGETILKDMTRTINAILPPTTITKICFTSNKLSTQFNIKDTTDFKHQNDIVYEAECPEPTCNSKYIGETARRIEERYKDHSGRDKNSHLLRHSIETGHPPTTLDNFRIIGRYFGNSWKRKISEALFIKARKPNLNIQEKSITLELLN